MELTQRQELFCQSYIETGNASEAYRASYSTARMKPETIHRAACRLMRVSNVCTRIDELRAAATKLTILTEALVIDDLLKIRAHCMQLDSEGLMLKPDTAVRALELLGRNVKAWAPDTMVGIQINTGRESFENILSKALYIEGGLPNWKEEKARQIGDAYLAYQRGETLPDPLIIGGLPSPFKIGEYVIETSAPLPEGTTISGPDHDFIAVPKKCETTEEWEALISIPKE